ncbi:HAD hydrolase family protein, partial [Candidatus Kaiserbacteria bacterium]|nr:HAD hydrolase family protein [Candidatus Kaiserbacteria bacterium]
LGVDAPAEKKRVWDPDRAKRAKLKAFLDKRLSRFSFDIRISSRTAIDITNSGIDKALGVRWLAERLGVEPKEMLFVGDDLKPHGNDAIVIPTGIQIRETSGPEETARIIEEIIATRES